MEMEKVTVYASGGFGIVKTEGKLVAHGRKKYAQYEDAPFVHFIEKGKRKPQGYCSGYKPFFLVLKGHGHPSPDEGFVKEDIQGRLSMQCVAGNDWALRSPARGNLKLVAA